MLRAHLTHSSFLGAMRLLTLKMKKTDWKGFGRPKDFFTVGCCPCRTDSSDNVSGHRPAQQDPYGLHVPFLKPCMQFGVPAPPWESSVLCFHKHDFPGFLNFNNLGCVCWSPSPNSPPPTYSFIPATNSSRHLLLTHSPCLVGFL